MVMPHIANDGPLPPLALTTVAAPAAVSPELVDRPRRRTFTAADKLRLLAEVDRAVGTPGAILRHEGIYSSSLTEWRRQREAGAYDGLSPVKRGPEVAAVPYLRAVSVCTEPLWISDAAISEPMHDSVHLEIALIPVHVALAEPARLNRGEHRPAWAPPSSSASTDQFFLTIGPMPPLANRNGCAPKRAIAHSDSSLA